jgi:predicted MFS family arabinose efflux permease
MGALLVVSPTMSMQVFGTKVGSEVYSFYWCSFAVANLIGYAYVSQLSSTIGFDNIFYICVGMAGLALLVMIFYDFKKDWSEVQEEVVVPPPEPQAIEMVNVTL